MLQNFKKPAQDELATDKQSNWLPRVSSRWRIRSLDNFQIKLMQLMYFAFNYNSCTSWNLYFSLYPLPACSDLCFICNISVITSVVETACDITDNFYHNKIMQKQCKVLIIVRYLAQYTCWRTAYMLVRVHEILFTSPLHVDDEACVKTS